MRWKLFWSKNDKPPKERCTYGFKSTAKAPPDPSLKEFETGLFDIVRKIEMRKVNNELLDKMKKDLDFVESLENEVIVPSDKTANFYIMRVEEYRGHLAKEIMKNYRKVGDEAICSIDEEAAQFARNLDIDDRVEGIAAKAARVSLKDHKPDYPQKLSFRLINPTNNNLGIVSKAILDRVNSFVRQNSNLNQWRST